MGGGCEYHRYSSLKKGSSSVANNALGPGAKGRIMTLLETHLKLPGDQSPFAVLRNDMATAILDSASRLMDELTARVRSILLDIHDWLQVMFYTDVEDEKEMEALEILAKFQGEAKDRYLSIQRDLERIEQRYRQVKKEAK